MSERSNIGGLSILLAFSILVGALALPAGADGPSSAERERSSGNEGGCGARAYTDRGPIKIIGDENFTSANGVTGGDGSGANPFMIQGWRLTRNDTVQQAMIYISGTGKHFVVKDCSIEGNRSANFSLGCTGIQLQEVGNATIQSCQMNGTDKGICLGDTTSGVMVFNCTISNDRSGFGIKFEGTQESPNENCTIENCTIHDYDYGIYGRALGSTFRGNDIHDNNNGISLGQSISNAISFNDIHQNSHNGIYLSSGDNNTIANNSVHDHVAGIGIHLSTANGNSVIGNNITSSMRGIDIEGNGNVIRENTIVDYLGVGISLDGTGNLIFLNLVKGPAGYNAGNFGGDNDWNSTEKGNYWSDYAGYDADRDGIGDLPHPIRAGGPNSQITDYDYRPIMAEPGAPPNLQPAAVTLSYSNLSDDYVHLSWTRSTEADFWQYAVLCSLDNATWSPLVNLTDINSTDSYRSGLTPNTTYSILVRLYDRGGLFNDSNKVTFRTLPKYFPKPVVVSLNVSRTSCDAGEELAFTVVAVAAIEPVVSYFFDFGDGSNSGWINSSSAAHKYAKAGQYMAWVEVKDQGGAVSEYYALPQPITVAEKPAGQSKSFIPAIGLLETLVALGLVSIVVWRFKKE